MLSDFFPVASSLPHGAELEDVEVLAPEHPCQLQAG